MSAGFALDELYLLRLCVRASLAAELSILRQARLQKLSARLDEMIRAQGAPV